MKYVGLCVGLMCIGGCAVTASTLATAGAIFNGITTIAPIVLATLQSLST